MQLIKFLIIKKEENSINKMKTIISYLIAVIFATTLQAQVYNDAEAHGCATHKQEAFGRMIKKKRASLFANTLMEQYDVKHYFLDLNIERNSTVISGSTTISAVLNVATDTFCFELNKNLVIDSIVYNNNLLAYTRDANSITYAVLPSTIAAGALVAVTIYYNGNANVAGSAAIGSGFSTGTSGLWGNQVTWSLSEPYSAVDWFACKQFLTDKADSATVHVTTNNQNKVASNGVLVNVESLPNNKVKYKWHTNYTIDYYLISIAVAKYVDYTYYSYPTALNGDSIKVVNYVYDNPNTLPYFKDDIDSIELFMENYCTLFGEYPFRNEKYGNAMAPFGGGMEHQTMTSLGNLGSMGINTHELLHHWFGDYVTCKTWGDIYINEGLTSYGEILTIEKYRPVNQLIPALQDLNDNITSQPGGSVFCTDTTNPNRIFSSRLSYDKGSMVTHTLRFVLGDSVFFKTLRNFLNQYKYSTASIADLKLVAETTSGKNLTDFFNQWIYGEGYPTWSVEYFSTSNHVVVRVKHQGSVTNNNLYKTPLQLTLKSPSGDTSVVVNIDANSNDFVFSTNKNITNILIDPNYKMARKIGTVTSNADLISNVQTVSSIKEFLDVQVGGNQLIITQKTPIKDNVCKVLDASGRELFSTAINGAVTTIDISNLANGVYFLATKLGSIQFVK